jgi:hypothetical protein
MNLWQGLFFPLKEGQKKFSLSSAGTFAENEKLPSGKVELLPISEKEKLSSSLPVFTELPI